jgi:PKD repeat protein
MPVTPRPHSATSCTLVGIVLVLSTAVLSGCLAAPSPVSSVDYSPKAGLAPLAVNFSVNASDPGIRVTWDFGDGTTGSGTRAEHVYAGPGEYSAGMRWTVPGGASGNRSGLSVSVYDPQNLPGNYSVGNLSPADMLYLSTLKQKVDLFDQYYIEFAYLNKSHATAMRYTSRDFQFAMKQSLSQLDSIETSPELGQVRESARVLFTNATDGAYAEFLAGINLEKGEVEVADTHLSQAWPKMEVAKAERDRLVPMLEAVQ